MCRREFSGGGSIRLDAFFLLRFSSSISMRNFSRVSSAVSLHGGYSGGGYMSVLTQLFIGSTLSVRSAFKSVGGEHMNSVLDFLELGSSLSVRTYARVGSGCSLVGNARIGMSKIALGCSIMNFFEVGSSLSLRASARLASSLSAVDWDGNGVGLSCIGPRFQTVGFKSVFRQSVSSQCQVPDLRSPNVTMSCQICGVMSDALYRTVSCRMHSVISGHAHSLDRIIQENKSESLVRCFPTKTDILLIFLACTVSSSGGFFRVGFQHFASRLRACR